MTAEAIKREDGIFGDVPAKDVDRVFDAFFSVARVMFGSMTPVEIADQIEMLTEADGSNVESVHATFKAITNLPMFVEWANTAEGRNALHDLTNK